MTPSGDTIAFGQFWEKYQKLKEEKPGQDIRAITLTMAKEFGLNASNNQIRELEENLRTIDFNSKILEDAVRTGIGPSTSSTTTMEEGSGGGGDTKKTDLQKAEEKYAEELKKLTNQKAAGAIKTEDYNKAIDDLNKATYEEIAGILGVNAERNKTFKLAKQGVESPLSAQTELAELTEGYNKSLKELDRKKQLGLISEEDYNSSLLSLIDSTADKIASFDKVGRSEEEYIANLKGMKPELAKTPTKGSRDTTFDYKKSKTDILGEELKLQEKYVEELSAEYKKVYGDLKNYSAEALAEIAKEEEKVTSLSDALKLAELKEDIEDLNKSLFSESISGITGFADALDRASRSWSRIANQDMSGFERMVAIINAMGDTIKGLISTWETYGTIREIISKKDQAAAALEASQKVANDATEAASAATKSAAVVAGLTAEEVAAKGVMAAKSAAAYAGMPFVGVGLAAGQIAAMEALISSAKAISMIPGFKDGGIIGGSSRSGDKTLIRANAGEMVLTTAHQSGLWNAIKKGDFGNNGGTPEIKLKLEGKDIVGSIKNYQQYLSRR